MLLVRFFFKLIFYILLKYHSRHQKSLEESADSMDMYLFPALDDCIHEDPYTSIVTDVIDCFCSN